MNLWRKTLQKVKIYYAVKVNSDPKIIRELVELNTGFDCSSINEMKLVLKYNANPEDIIFTHPIK